MRKTVFAALIIAAVMLVVPLFNIKNEETTDKMQTLPTAATAKEKAENKEQPESRVFRIKTEKGIQTIPEEEYIIGVVAAEMPYTYNIEALKAQSVAAYTFALYRKAGRQNEDYDLTDSYKTDQSFIPIDRLKEKWADGYEEKISVIKKAVSETAGEYLAFSGEVALALYHSLSGGTTNACADIFGGEPPYLTLVDSQWDKLSPDYKSVFSFSADELVNKLSSVKKATADGNLFGNAKTAGVAVKEIEYAGKAVTGSQLCSLLELPSPNFTVEYSDGAYTFTCFGKGHGVGMSQYGANYLANAGSDYKQILSHYYPGTELKKMLDK